MRPGRPHDRPATRRGPTRRARRVALASCGALVLLLTACTGGQTTDASPSTLPPHVSVELRQLRSDVASRWAQVMITNDGPTALVVGGVRVDDPRFDGPAERINDRESTVRAGSTVAIPVQLPAVACPAPDDATPTVTLDWSTTDASGTATARLTDPLSFVPPLHARECRAQALEAAADVTISAFTPSAPGQPADLSLTITPTGDGDAKIVAIHSTNLLTWAGHPNVDYPLDVVITGDGTAPVEVHLPMIPLRCDPHVVQEDKRGTVFNVDIELDGEPGQIQLAAGEEMRGHILTWVGQWCGFPN
ncbi:hypothetical protein ACSBPH_09185 [Microbacterium sp. F51-2R]|uniref:hypothetical protein n=1 Tax=Microbacterium sp. F51-2R TaxID=3445777 RepID=UPI003FA055B0